MAKILILDIETTPNIAYVWRFFKENIGPSQVVKQSNILSFAAKWVGSDEIIYVDTHLWSEKFLLQTVNKYLDEADIVVTHYGDRFDLPRIRARSLTYGLAPPSPYKTIDTCLVAKRIFSFESNKLEYIADKLGVGKKMTKRQFAGFELWKGVLSNDPEAWKEMQEYNKQDVLLTERVYLAMRPWMPTHPNVAVFAENKGHVCPKCGGKHLERRGFQATNVGKYQRFRCNDCGGWSRTRFTEYPKDRNKALLVNA
jgi:DNA polymerase elongation subunit (family B)